VACASCWLAMRVTVQVIVLVAIVMWAVPQNS
jgi:hypothetical protein